MPEPAGPCAPLLSDTLERALRRSAEWHREQRRRGSGVPYVQHLFGVAMILVRLGFDDGVVAAGLLHDAVEDVEIPLERIRHEFGDLVTQIVADCSERKRDDQGRDRPWSDRKREHLELLVTAPVASRAVALADKLQNLISIEVDLQTGIDLWSLFHASPNEVLDYYRAAAILWGQGDPRLERLAHACLDVIHRLRIPFGTT